MKETWKTKMTCILRSPGSLKRPGMQEAWKSRVTCSLRIPGSLKRPELEGVLEFEDSWNPGV